MQNRDEGLYTASTSRGPLMSRQSNFRPRRSSCRVIISFGTGSGYKHGQLGNSCTIWFKYWMSKSVLQLRDLSQTCASAGEEDGSSDQHLGQRTVCAGKA